MAKEEMLEFPGVVTELLPNATFRGEDKQLDAAIAFLKEEIRKKPVTVPPAPKYPNKAFTPNATTTQQGTGRP